MDLDEKFERYAELGTCEVCGEKEVLVIQREFTKRGNGVEYPAWSGCCKDCWDKFPKYVRGHGILKVGLGIPQEDMPPLVEKGDILGDGLRWGSSFEYEVVLADSEYFVICPIKTTRNNQTKKVREIDFNHCLIYSNKVKNNSLKDLNLIRRRKYE